MCDDDDVGGWAPRGGPEYGQDLKTRRGRCFALLLRRAVIVTRQDLRGTSTSTSTSGFSYL